MLKRLKFRLFGLAFLLCLPLIVPALWFMQGLQGVHEWIASGTAVLEIRAAVRQIREGRCVGLFELY
jgi:hypothetical protein